MYEILSDIHELVVTAIVIMDMQERVFNTYCWIEDTVRIWAEYMSSYVW